MHLHNSKFGATLQNFEFWKFWSQNLSAIAKGNKSIWRVPTDKQDMWNDNNR